VVLRVPLAYILANFTRSAEFPNGHPFALSISMLTAWVLGMLVSAAAFRWGKTRKMIRSEMALQAQQEA
jgi:Na+-driven multidrug efflux pump